MCLIHREANSCKRYTRVLQTENDRPLALLLQPSHYLCTWILAPCTFVYSFAYSLLSFSCFEPYWRSISERRASCLHIHVPSRKKCVWLDGRPSSLSARFFALALKKTLVPVEDPGYNHFLHAPGLHPGIVVYIRSLPNSSFFILGISHPFLHRSRTRIQIFRHLPVIMSCLLTQYANSLLTLSARRRFLIKQTLFLTPLSWALSLFSTSRTLLSQL